jgi:hypothetical protein
MTSGFESHGPTTRKLRCGGSGLSTIVRSHRLQQVHVSVALEFLQPMVDIPDLLPARINVSLGLKTKTTITTSPIRPSRASATSQ